MSLFPYLPLSLRRALIKWPVRTKILLSLAAVALVLLFVVPRQMGDTAKPEADAEEALTDREHVDVPVAAPPTAASVEDAENIAFAVANGVTAPELRVFLDSLKKYVMSRTRIVLIVDEEMPGATGLPEFVGSGVEIITVRPKEYPFPWRYYQPSSWRYYAYQIYLKESKTQFKRILLADARDTVFQSDPFAIIKENALYLFYEWGRSTIGNPNPGKDREDNTNRQTIVKCYGWTKMEDIQSRPVCNAGFMVGTARAVLPFVDLMVRELSRLYDCEERATDQAALNYLLHTGQIGRAVGNVKALHVESGPVVSLKYIPTTSDKFDADGQLINGAGVPYAVVHQWDTHKQVAAAVYKRYPDPGRTFEDVVDDSAIVEEEQVTYFSDEGKEVNEAPPSKAMLRMMRTDWTGRRRLVLAYGTSDVERLALFLVSLRHAVRMTSTTMPLLPLGTDIVLFEETVAMPQIQWMAERFTVTILPKESADGEPVAKQTLYKDYLEAHGDKYTDVLLADASDTYFQSDPFFVASAKKQLHVFNEIKGAKVGSTRARDGSQISQAIMLCFGDGELAEVIDHTISSAGIVLGGPAAVRLYTGYVGSFYSSSPRCNMHARGESAAHNYVVLSGLLTGGAAGVDVVPHANEEGHVCNFEYETAEPSLATYDDGEYVLNAAGEVCGVIHELAAVPKVTELFAAKYAGTLREARAERDKHLRTQYNHKHGAGDAQPRA